MLRLTSKRLIRRNLNFNQLKQFPKPLTTSQVNFPRWINDKPRARLSSQRRGGAPDNSNDRNVKFDNDDGKRSASSNDGLGDEGSSGGNSNNSNEDDDNGSQSKSSTSVTKNTPPSYFPRVLALPINRRPLFPG